MEMNDVLAVLRKEFMWTKRRLDRLAEVNMEDFTDAYESYERRYDKFYHNLYFVINVTGLAEEELERQLGVNLRDIEFC